MTLPYHTPLSPAEQIAAGLPEVWPLAMADKVRFNEIDALNHVNNVAYMVWLEVVRTRYFRLSGMTQYRTGDPRIVIRRGEIDYLQEMVAEEDYVVTCRCASFRTSSCVLSSEIWSITRRVAFSCVIVLLQPDGSGRHPIPDDVIQRFLADGAEDRRDA